MIFSDQESKTLVFRKDVAMLMVALVIKGNRIILIKIPIKLIVMYYINKRNMLNGCFSLTRSPISSSKQELVDDIPIYDLIFSHLLI
jgi:hypothetical protein